MGVNIMDYFSRAHENRNDQSSTVYISNNQKTLENERHRREAAAGIAFLVLAVAVGITIGFNYSAWKEVRQYVVGAALAVLVQDLVFRRLA